MRSACTAARNPRPISTRICNNTQQSARTDGKVRAFFVKDTVHTPALPSPLPAAPSGCRWKERSRFAFSGTIPVSAAEGGSGNAQKSHGHGWCLPLCGHAGQLLNSILERMNPCASAHIICASRHHAAGASLQSTSFSSVPFPKIAVLFASHGGLAAFPTKPPFHAKKLQTGTMLPVFSALYREFAELPVCFALWAIQPAQKRVDVLYRLHESDFGLLIFYTNYAIL